MRPLSRCVAGVAVGVMAGVLAACGGSDAGDFDTPSSGPPPVTADDSSTGSTGGTPVAGPTPRVVSTVASSLAVPWGVAFLPDRSALVTERISGRVLHLVAGRTTEIGRLDVVGEGEGGLLGVAVSPSYATDHHVFLYETTGDDNRIVRATYDGRPGSRLGPTTPVLTGIPSGVIHNGGRLDFGPDGYLYASTGETGDGGLAQDPRSLGGKILRMTPTGDPAPGNPDPKSVVWTIGHRNVQGLAFDSSGRLWASEFGDQTWDELNLITKGTNYGWPDVEGKGASDQRFRNPQVVWHTDDASPSGLAWTPGSARGEGTLWLGSLRGERLWRVTVRDGRASDPKPFFVGRYGRLRSVVPTPDGRLWITTSDRDGRGAVHPGDDKILEVELS